MVDLINFEDTIHADILLEQQDILAGQVLPPSVLLATNREITRKIISARLSTLGFNVVCVEDGFSALEHLADKFLEDGQSVQPNIIIAEEDLAGRSGLKLLQDLRVAKWAVPFILIVGEERKPSRWLPRSQGQVCVFRYPFQIDDLLTAVFWLLRSPLPQRQIPQA
jgi:CheY-like chemotaxis protein